MPNLRSLHPASSTRLRCPW